MKMRMKIGVMGSASGATSENKEYRARSYQIGRWIARNKCILITGACPGLPAEAARGAHAEKGFVFGVSPAFSRREHLEEYKSPDDGYDFILYSGMGFMERDIVNIRSADGVIILGGGMGTLNEFSVAYEEGKPIGVLSHSGGISDHIPQIVGWCERDLRASIVFEADPRLLVEKLVSAIKSFPAPTHEDARVKDIRFGKARG